MKRKLAPISILIAAIIAAGGIQSSAGMISNEDSRYIPDQFVIGINESCCGLNTGDLSTPGFTTGIGSLDELCSRYGIIKIEPFYRGKIRNAIHVKKVVDRLFILITDGSADIRTVVQVFADDRNLRYAELVEIPVPFYRPNDPYISDQWFLEKIRAFEAWDMVRGEATRPVIIGIDDTGICYNHPDIEPNMWINQLEDINGNGVFDNYPSHQGGDLNYTDDDRNGFVDDVIGYDFYDNDPDPWDELPPHGTHIAGCVSAAADNAIGGAGVGFSARLMAVRGVGSHANQAYQALIYCVDNGAQLANCSWGTREYRQSEQDIITAVFYDGCLVIGAVGAWSNNDPTYPAAYDNCMAVTATDENDRHAYFANYGEWVTIASPGVNILSTDCDGYTYLTGTSPAAAICTGAAALIQAQDTSRAPGDVWELLTESADSAALYGANPGRQGQLGSGRVDAYAALLAGLELNIFMEPDNPPVVVPAGSSFTFTGILANNTDEPRVADVAVFLDVPGYGAYGPIKRYLNIHLAPNQIIEIPGIVQEVPAFAPLGTYEYVAGCGDFPSNPVHRASFEFTITGPMTDGAEDWNISGWFDDNSETIAADYIISGNYPNPFNSSTEIRYILPALSNVRIDIYNLLGRHVETLIDGYQQAGEHKITWDSSDRASGIYFYRLNAGDKIITGRMTLLK